MNRNLSPDGRLGVENAVLDGELVCLDESGRSQFYDLMSRRKPPTYHAFDLLWVDGVDLRDRSLLERKAYLRERLPPEPTQILDADHVEERGIEFFRKVCEMDLEGIVRSARAGSTRAVRGGSRSGTPTTARRRGGASSLTRGGRGTLASRVST